MHFILFFIICLLVIKFIAGNTDLLFPLIFAIILFCMTGCIPKRIGYYSGAQYINCDTPKTEDEKRICNNIQQWDGLNK